MNIAEQERVAHMLRAWVQDNVINAPTTQTSDGQTIRRKKQYPTWFKTEAAILAKARAPEYPASDTARLIGMPAVNSIYNWVHRHNAENSAAAVKEEEPQQPLGLVVDNLIPPTQTAVVTPSTKHQATDIELLEARVKTLEDTIRRLAGCLRVTEVEMQDHALAYLAGV